jgi:hypothetical protein
MDFIATLCEVRFEALLEEPRGDELVSARSGVIGPDLQQLHTKVAIGAHRMKYAPPEPDPACCRIG